MGVGFSSFIARASKSLPYSTIATVHLLSSLFDTSSIHYCYRALHHLSTSAIFLSFLFSAVRRFSSRRDGTHAVTAIVLCVVYGVTAIALGRGIQVTVIALGLVYQVTAIALGCCIRSYSCCMRSTVRSYNCWTVIGLVVCHVLLLLCHGYLDSEHCFAFPEEFAEDPLQCSSGTLARQ